MHNCLPAWEKSLKSVKICGQLDSWELRVDNWEVWYAFMLVTPAWRFELWIFGAVSTERSLLQLCRVVTKIMARMDITLNLELGTWNLELWTAASPPLWANLLSPLGFEPWTLNLELQLCCLLWAKPAACRLDLQVTLPYQPIDPLSREHLLVNDGHSLKHI